MIKSDHAVDHGYIEGIKKAVCNYATLGGGVPFEQFNALVHYDQRNSRWMVDHDERPMTLLSKDQLDLIDLIIRDLEVRNVPGNYIEAGIWRGGAVILMRALLNAYNIVDRVVFAADSFAGIPKNTKFLHDPVDLWVDRWAASLEEVKANVSQFGLLDDRIKFVEGYFEESLGTLADKQFALVRLDSDSYDSVMTSLEHLYPRISVGGVVIIDDWHLPGCRMAVDAYRAKHGITEPMLSEAGNGYWTKQQKTAGADQKRPGSFFAP
jgi:O-methyltransferase